MVGFFSILYNKQQYDESIEWYEKLLLVDPDNALVYYYIAQVYVQIEKYKESIEYFNKSIDLDPNH